LELFFSFVIGSVGLAYFVYGKKMTELSFMLFGLLLMVYPYFIPNIILSIIIGLVFLMGPFILNKVL